MQLYYFTGLRIYFANADIDQLQVWVCDRVLHVASKHIH